MANFFSDSDEDKAVEELLSQAKESTILEQVAAINCAGFTDSGLPSHLETRFQKLKSFPSNPTSLSTKGSSPSQLNNSDSVDNKMHNSDKNGDKDEKGSSKCSMKNPESNKCLSPSKSSDSGSFSPFKTTPQGKMNKKSPSWDDFSSRSVSPPAKSGCFLCSPKRFSKKKSKENRDLDLDLGLDWGKLQHDELLSDLSNSQRKMIKKAMEEEKRICREADKIVKWAKQASARMDVSGIEFEAELSDDENAKFP